MVIFHSYVSLPEGSVHEFPNGFIDEIFIAGETSTSLLLKTIRLKTFLTCFIVLRKKQQLFG